MRPRVQPAATAVVQEVLADLKSRKTEDESEPGAGGFTSYALATDSMVLLKYYCIKMIRPKTARRFTSYSALMRRGQTKWMSVRCGIKIARPANIKIARPANAMLSCANPPIPTFIKNELAMHNANLCTFCYENICDFVIV